MLNPTDHVSQLAARGICLRLQIAESESESGMDRVLRQVEGARQLNQNTGRGCIQKEMQLVASLSGILTSNHPVRTEDEPRVFFGKRSYVGADYTETV